MKSAAEVKKISEAARIAKEILGNLAPWKFGTEEKLSAHLKMEALRFGCEISFEPIVATGANSAMPHRPATPPRNMQAGKRASSPSPAAYSASGPASKPLSKPA